MKWLWLKKHKILILCFAALIIGSIIYVAQNLMDKQYDKVIRYISSMLGVISYLFLDSLYQNKLKNKIKNNLILVSLLIIGIYIIPLVASFLLSVISSNLYIRSIGSGLIIPCTLFSFNRLNMWLEKGESPQDSEKKKEKSKSFTITNKGGD